MINKCFDFKGYTSVVHKLLKEGHDVNRKNGNGDTALHLCCERGNEDCIKLLIQYEANLFEKNRAGRTPYDYLKLPHLRHILDSDNSDDLYKKRESSIISFGG